MAEMCIVGRGLGGRGTSRGGGKTDLERSPPRWCEREKIWQ